MTKLYKVFHICWREGGVPQDMKDANIVTYKNKGDRGDCNNYSGISLLSVVGKLLACVVLKRLQVLADRVYPESKCGFRANRPTIEMVFSLRQLQDKCREQQQPLCVAFIDRTKAFDLVSSDGLFKIFPKIGCPPWLLNIIRSFHSSGNEGPCSFWWLNIRSLWHPKQSEKGLCPHADPVWDLFCCPAGRGIEAVPEPAKSGRWNFNDQSI